MEFRTAYTKAKTKPSNAGEKEVMTYKARLNKEGKKVLVEDVKINIYEKTQLDKEEADIHTVINRAKLGDKNSIELLQKETKGGLTDLTKMPSNLIEAKQKIIDAENTWDNMDKDLKAYFNNNVDEFIAGASNGKIEEYIKSKMPKEETITPQNNDKGETL